MSSATVKMHSKNKAWLISVDMGYGHQRAAYPLKDIAYERIITANSDKIITPKEKKKWLDGVVFSGGEPLLHKELPLFMKKIKDMGYLIKIDTNGTNPKLLKEPIGKVIAFLNLPTLHS